MPKLIIQENYKVSSAFDIPEGETAIGRGPGAGLRLEQPGISPLHCRLRRKGMDVSLEDAGSRKGTFLNGHPVQKAVNLRHRDHIQLDNILLIYDAADFAANYQAEEQGNTELSFVKTIAERLDTNIAKVIQGKDDVIRKVLVALMSDGHVLLEDVPGVGKTKLAQALARSIHTDFKRIQFTPDMLPNDVTGISVYDERSKAFTFMPGPIFANVVLADEINRGTPRVQSSLLECMEESMVTVDGNPHVLRKPFFVIATQNPIDFHGTYPLPEAQLDRFLMRLSMGYPEPETEKEILRNQASLNPLNSIEQVAEGNDVLRCQSLVRTVHVSEQVRDYITAIVNETRNHPALGYGCSPRASLALMHAAQALAAMAGRDHVLPRDVRDLAVSVLAHRVPLKLQARAEWPDGAAVLKSILEQLPISHWEEDRD